MRHGFINLIQIILVVVAAFFLTQAVIAQPGELGESTQQQTTTQSYIPKPGIKPEKNFPARTIQRTGTAIVGARNSVSIKSTDAGIIHHPPATSAAPNSAYGPNRLYGPTASNCINCGIIDFINIIGQDNALNAMAGGIIAGTIARKIGGYGAYPHPHHAHGDHPEHSGRGQHQHYHVGITMHDGSRQIITVPDVSHLHRGDSVQLIDGMIVPESADR